MTLTVEEAIEYLRSQHEPYKSQNSTVVGCGATSDDGCNWYDAWPCPTAIVLDELERLREEATRCEAMG